jgi:hypothetical protein
MSAGARAARAWSASGAWMEAVAWRGANATSKAWAILLDASWLDGQNSRYGSSTATADRSSTPPGLGWTVAKGLGAMGQPGLRLIPNPEDSTVQPVVSAPDLPIGPLAGLEIALWRSATGKADHASPVCPRLVRGTPRQTRMITLPTTGTFADIPAIPRCASCPDPLPAYHQQATRLLHDANELAKAATALHNGYNLVTYGHLLRTAEHDSLETHQDQGLDRLLRPALRRLRTERQHLVGQYRYTYTDERAQRDLKTIAAASLLEIDVSRRQPGPLRSELLNLASRLVAEVQPDPLHRISYRQLLDLSDAWLAPIRDHYANNAGMAELDTAKQQLHEGLDQLLTPRDPGTGRGQPPPEVDRLTTLLHAASIGVLAGLVAAGSTEHAVVAVDPRLLLPLPFWTSPLLFSQYPSAARDIDQHRYHVALVPRLFADLAAHPRYSHQALYVIAESVWVDDADVCQAVLEQIPARAFAGYGPWWQRLRPGQLQRLLDKSRAISPRRLGG